jgi:hypothetical protein
MSWNYRVFKRKITLPPGIPKTDLDPEYYYEIREVYYNQNHEITAFSAESLGIGAESIEELKKVVQMILDNIDRFKDDVLEEDKIVFGKMDGTDGIVDSDDADNPDDDQKTS